MPGQVQDKISRAHALNNYGVLLADQHRFDEAIASYAKEALRLHPGYPGK